MTFLFAYLALGLVFRFLVEPRFLGAEKEMRKDVATLYPEMSNVEYWFIYHLGTVALWPMKVCLLLYILFRK